MSKPPRLVTRSQHIRKFLVKSFSYSPLPACETIDAAAPDLNADVIPSEMCRGALVQYGIRTVVHEFAHEFMSALHPRYISVLYAHVQSISLEYSRVSRTRIARASSFPYIIPRLLTQRTIFIPTSNTPNPPNLYIRICFVIIRDDNSLLIHAYVLLYHVIFLRIFTSLIPLNFRLYPDYSSISHSRFLSKNGDGVGIRWDITSSFPAELLED